MSLSKCLLFAALVMSVGAAEAANEPPGATQAEESVAASAAPPVEAPAAAEASPAGDDAIAPFDDAAEPEPDTAEQAAVRAALARPAANPAPVHPELRAVFDQFGGEAGLVALMDDFMQRLLADPRMRPFFENADQAKVKRHLVEQFCAILDGGCAYTGRDMARTHAGLGIDRADFNALVEDLQLAMDARGIPFRAQNKLLATLAPMHREIEGK
jgi:hemoglobin